MAFKDKEREREYKAQWGRNWRKAHPEESREKRREWARNNPDKVKAHKQASKARHPDTERAYNKKYKDAHKESNKKYNKEWKMRNPEYFKNHLKTLRLDAFNHYGGAICACCGETQYEFLALDHINGGGGEHRRSIGGGTNLYSWLKKNNYPEGFQVLCHNCNMAKAYYGKCPHQT